MQISVSYTHLDVYKRQMLDKAIFLMHKEKVQVGLKAVVTEANRKWTSLALHDEIRKEHEIMSRREAERKR